MPSTAQTQPPPYNADIRELTFQDGSSHKFWHISLQGASHTVRFGRVGTHGQTQTKEFADAEQARKSFSKLVGEKLKKGYFDAADIEPAPPTATAAPSKAARAGKKKAAEPEPETPSAPDVVQTASARSPELTVTRSIDLTPADWLYATFLPRQPLAQPAAALFDLDQCIAKLAKLRSEQYGWEIRWRDLDLPAALSRQEAHFWFEAMTTVRLVKLDPDKLAAKLAKKTFDGNVSAALAGKLLEDYNRHLPDLVALPLANLIEPREYFEMTRHPLQPTQRWQEAEVIGVLTRGFRNYVLPYLNEEETASFRQTIRRGFNPTLSPVSGGYDALPVDYYLAAILGMHDEVFQVTSTWADDRYGKDDYSDHYQRPQELVLALATPELIASEWRRLKLRMRGAEHVRGFLACTQYDALDCVRDSIVAETNKEKTEELLGAFTRVHAPEAAEPMLACILDSKMPAIARDWLTTNLDFAVTGLIDTAAGRGRLADAALDFLRDAKRLGHAALIEAALNSGADADRAAIVRREVLDREEKTYQAFDDDEAPRWLQAAIADADFAKARKLPSWAAPAVLPPLVVDDRRLNDRQMGVVLKILAAMSVATRHPLLIALREHVGAPFRDALAWKLFQSWLADGAPAKEKWAMGAIGHLGGDDCALRLTPLVRAWPGESQHQRAVFGLECLRAIGSDAALMQLAGVAQKLKFKGLKAKAEQFVNEIAAQRGMTRAELEDRVVPDCGLDENGRREFSFGPRSFSFALGGDLKPMIRDADGKLRGDLPKPGAKDDAAIAGQSVAEWKLLKKQIRDVAQLQAGRLEQAMVTGRRWKTADFLALLVRHPLLTHLVRQIVWGAFDEQGGRVATFRVTEERDFADAADNAVSLDSAATVGVAHPLELSLDERAAWGDVLSDYEIVPPFAQLGRAVYGLEQGEEHERDLTRFHGLKLVAPTLVFTLEKLGWTRGIAMDGGCFDEHSKQYSAAGVTAVVGYQGNVDMGYINPDEMLTIESVHFVAGMRPPSGYGWDSKQKLELGQVPPVVLSEVLADVQMLKSKSK